jgi:hypothetical protein
MQESRLSYKKQVVLQGRGHYNKKGVRHRKQVIMQKSGRNTLKLRALKKKAGPLIEGNKYYRKGGPFGELPIYR